MRGNRTGGLRIIALAIWLLAFAAPAVRADELACSVPDGLAFGGFSLPRSKSQVMADKPLVVLAIGGASMGGLAAGGRAYSVPMRLETRLQEALPGHDIAVASRAIEGGAHEVADQMAASIRGTGASLVIWETGSRAAVAGDDPEMFGTSLESGIDAAQHAKADIILMDLQYAPSIARVMNLTRYIDVIRGAAEMEGIPLLHRFDLMHAWSDSGELDLDAENAAERVKVARKLYDCLAVTLATGIAGALR